ncbi:RelA/SpoT family protein [Gimibacter soli]|uniref:GTP pyrophosphokinase rsh n=1 Tax=Gimibacter soli TaxID=3024400 RepID=A0AAF0BIS1_9PROT|nr:bifunctional (p)ppGpp synthetase/guanosine-3',5'-bis(diphosphate) 3'-pyrophosphohydrolase [Gimibacter soli]WCL55738.1 bifunctional (p)ppGpp synthetase/guanosine-3',5'-bis(diphosphate) 3'-pyrophosphohydrolase [Gimibacter soli]
MIRQFELVETVKAYDPDADETLLNRAYVFAMKAHGTQTRASGDPYFSHPLEVAGILTSLKLDGDTIATALLHDVVEDTLSTLEEIEELFGTKIREMVDGVTKLSKIELQTESVRQAENFRKFLLAMSNDIRVLLVKLADRLHNMRTLHYIKKEEKRRRIALETLEIYAPLAERIGMHEMKDELEHLAFQQLDPEAMQSITARLHYLIEQNPTLEMDMSEALKGLMRKNGLEADISGRIKRPYSIWRKMERRNISFEELSDVMAFRVIVNDTDACYRALGVVHQEFAMIPGRFKDYISTPKRNYYRSLHTTVIGPHKRRLEIQIRTRRMHEEAELGVAAHWQYKQTADGVEGSQFRWLRELLEILEHASDPEEFLEHTKLAMYQETVFCFTPKGELISLPRGASPVDFAYAVHTQVGDRCVGAKVNGRMVPLRHQLQNGDQVEILTSKGQTPSPRWENFVVTGKARSAIRRHMRHQRDAEFSQLGVTLVSKAFRRHGLDYSDKVLSEAAKVLKVEDAHDLYTLVGQGTLSEEDVLKAAYPGFQMDARAEGLPKVHQGVEDVVAGAMPIQGVGDGAAVHLADCCHPVRGDRIVGIRIADVGVEIHRIDCRKLDLYDDRPAIWLDLAWQDSRADDAFYVGRLRLEVVNEMGALANITAMVAKAGGNISNLQMTERDPEFYTMLVDVEVRDVKHLTDIVRALRVNRVISNVERVSG